MAAPGCRLTQDQLLCDVCLDVFSEPVTLPCGHTFCRACVERRWTPSSQRRCPTCEETACGCWELRVNDVVSDVSLRLRGSQRSQLASEGDVGCDVCGEPKRRAVRSCLACLASYCHAHLKPHLGVARLKRHQLTAPTADLEGRLCPEHLRPLQLFCRTDQTCVCTLCPVLEHKSHDFAPLEERYEEKRAELGRWDQEIQEMVRERRRAIRDARLAVRFGRRAAEREAADGVRVFAALKRSVRRAEAELVEALDEEQRTAETQARGLVQDLSQEISELLSWQEEAEHLCAAKDHLYFLQNLRTLSSSPAAVAAATATADRDWTAVGVSPPAHEGALRSALERLHRTLGEEMETMVREAELNRLRQFSVDVTLDPDTAHSALLLSEDGKRVHHGLRRRGLPDRPERFDPCCCVVARQAFAAGSFYFEVQVEGKSRWTVGVAAASVQRKGVVPLCPANGHWTVWLKNGDQYAALVGTPRRLTLSSPPRRVGVFVDVDGGVVSFYDGDTAAVLHSFAGCSFTDKLLPFFSPGVNDDGVNSAPLVIVDAS